MALFSDPVEVDHLDGYSLACAIIAASKDLAGVAAAQPFVG